MKYYVYVFLDPRKPGNYQYGEHKFDYEPFYVGKGKDNRFQRHLNLSQLNSNHNPHKERILKKILEASFNPLDFVEILHENLLEEEASSLEKQEIKTIGRSNLKLGPLTNLTDGGEGMSGNLSMLKGKTYEEIHGIEKANTLKEQKRQSCLGSKNPMYGKVSHWKGRTLPQEIVNKISLSRERKVKQLDRTDTVIKVWRTAKEASVSLDIGLSSIHNVLSPSQRAKTSGGFRWEYVDTPNLKYLKVS